MSANVVMNLIEDTVVPVNGGETTPQIAPLLHNPSTCLALAYKGSPGQVVEHYNRQDALIGCLHSLQSRHLCTLPPRVANIATSHIIWEKHMGSWAHESSH